MIALIGQIIGWLLAAAILVFLILLHWAQHKQTEALWRACCKLMGIPEDTPYRFFKQPHREMKKQRTRKEEGE